MVIKVNENPPKITEESLFKQSLKYQSLYESFIKNFNTEKNLSYYIISSKWLQNWKEFVCYEEAIEKNKIPIDPQFAENYPGEFNDDLIIKESKSILKENNDEIILKDFLKEDIDFIIFNYDLMNFFAQLYKGTIIIRNAYILPNGFKRVEVNLPKVN